MRKLVVICGLVAQKSSAALLAIMLCAAMVMPGPAEAYRDTPTPGNQPSTAPAPPTTPAAPTKPPVNSWLAPSVTDSQNALRATLTPTWKGLRIGRVDPNGPAGRGGLEPRDVITEVDYGGNNWRTTRSVDDLLKGIDNVKSVGGSFLQIKVLDHRSNQVQFVTLQF